MSGAPLIMITALPEIIAAYYEDFKIQSENEQINCHASGLYSTTMAFGHIMGSVGGGILYDNFGYRHTIDICLGVSLLVLITYMVFNLRSPKKEVEDRLEPLKQ